MTRRFASMAVNDVRVPDDTLRQLDQAWAEALGAMMAKEGQAQPIEVAAVGSTYVLVFGLHRLEGARRAGLKTIDALVDPEGGDAAARRRRAIHENLFRRELSYLDRAIHIDELHGLAQARVGERRGGARRLAKDQKSDDRTFGLLEQIAEKVGLSRSTVADAVKIAHAIGRGVRRRISATPALQRLADSRADLMVLAGQDNRTQTVILDLIADEDCAAATVAEAIALLNGERKPTETERLWTLAVNALSRLNPKQRNDVFRQHRDEIIALVRAEGWLR